MYRGLWRSSNSGRGGAVNFFVALVEFTVGFFVDLFSGALLESILDYLGLGG